MVPKTIEYFALKISICLLRQPLFLFEILRGLKAMPENGATVLNNFIIYVPLPALTLLYTINIQFTADVNGILQDALNRLPEKQREAIILYFYENMSYHQISEIMQMTKVKSARALIYRALDSLTALLGKADYLCAIVFWFFFF